MAGKHAEARSWFCFAELGSRHLPKLRFSACETIKFLVSDESPAETVLSLGYFPTLCLPTAPCFYRIFKFGIKRGFSYLFKFLAWSDIHDCIYWKLRGKVSSCTVPSLSLQFMTREHGQIHTVLGRRHLASRLWPMGITNVSNKQMVVDQNSFIPERPFFANKNFTFAKLSRTPCLSFAGPMLANNTSYEDSFTACQITPENHGSLLGSLLNTQLASRNPFSGQIFFAKFTGPPPSTCTLTFTRSFA